MSENTRDDDELEAFLKGESPLSRRYREDSAEEPPAKVDAAILAAAEWAVGGGAGSAKGGARGPRRGATSQPGSGGWGSLLSRWSTPLAAAAVLVVAVTLTLMIERDPELEQIEKRHDPLALKDSPEIAAVAPADLKAQADAAPTESGIALNVPVQPRNGAADESKEAAQQAAKPATTVAEEPARIEFRRVDEADAVAAREMIAKREAERARQAEISPDLSEVETADVTAPDPAPVPAPAPAAEPAPALEEDQSMEEQIATELAAVETEAERVDDPAPDRDLALAESSARGESADTDAAPAEGLTPFPATELGGQRISALPDEEPPSSSAQGASGDAETQFEPARTVPVVPAASGSRSAGRDPDEWIADIEEQLALGNRELARAALRNFRERYPDYELPEALQELYADTDR